MSQVTNLAPLQDIDEHEVIGFFTYSGTIPANKGSVVMIGGSGFRSEDTDTQFLGSPGATYGNTYSQRYGVKPYVQDLGSTTGTAQTPLGIMMLDIREVDENGEKLLFNPRKAAEMQVAVSGQPVTILTRGVVRYSGVDGTVTAGQTLYGSGGRLTSNNWGGAAVAQALSTKDDNGYVVIKVKL